MRRRPAPRCAALRGARSAASRCARTPRSSATRASPTPFAHVVALDPPAHARAARPLHARGRRAAPTWPGARLSYAFAARSPRARATTCAPPLVAALPGPARPGGAAGEALEALLRGDGPHRGRSARPGAACASSRSSASSSLDRDLPAADGRRPPSAPTLERSPAFRAYAAALRGRTAIPEQRNSTERPDGHAARARPAAARRHGAEPAREPRGAARRRARRRPVDPSSTPPTPARRDRRADLTDARARAARRPVRDRRGARRRGAASRSTATRVEEAFVFACEHHADQRRKSGEDFIIHPVGVAKICAGMRLDTETLCAALLHDTVEDTTRVARGGPRAVRRGGRRPRRRRHQAHRHHVPVARRGAGRELPQDDGRDGHGHPGHPDQARRPPAQHAHDRRDAQAEADREGQGDARDLRAARAPPRHPRDQVGARGPRVRDAAPAQVPGDQGPGQPAARGARALRRQGRRLPGARSSRRSASRPRSPAAPSTSTRSTRR